jgi:hypothetical protein
MARPRVTDGGNCLQLWGIAANTLNKQQRTADKGLSSSLKAGLEANNLSRQKNKFVTKIQNGPRTWTYSVFLSMLTNCKLSPVRWNKDSRSMYFRYSALHQ